MDFEDKLTEVKEKAFKDYIIQASKILNLSFIPEVKVWDGECPYTRGNEIAHAHPDRRLICIPRSHIKSMTLEEIKDVAIHETVHMLVVDHNMKFKTIDDETRLVSWIIEKMRPRVKKEIKKKEETELKKNKNECNYHLCKMGKLNKCKYCEGYFCKEHSKPRIAGIPDFSSTRKEDILFIEEYHKIGGHPCFPYYNHWKAEQEKKEEEYREALDRLLKTPQEVLWGLSKEKPEVKETKKVPIEKQKKDDNYRKETEETKMQLKGILYRKLKAWREAKKKEKNVILQ